MPKRRTAIANEGVAQSTPAPDSLPLWARPGFVLAAIFCYLAVHFAIRLTLWPTLAADDSEQALFAQHFAWSYRYSGPPLYTWLLLGLGQVIPIDVVALSLLRYALLGITFVFAYLSSRRLLSDPRLAALSVFSFAAIDIFAQASHRELTHATASAALVSLAWYVFIRLCAAPRLNWYLALGATFGFGMLAKWNFAILAIALPVACLFRRDFRHLVLTWKILPSAALAAALVLPTVLFALQAGPLPGDDIDSVLSNADGRSLRQMLEGTLRLANVAIGYPVPFFPLLLVVFGLPLWRGIRAEPGSPPSPPRPDVTLVGATIVVGLVLTWATVPLLGATDFEIRYIYPVLLILPTWTFMIAERGRPSARAMGIFALLLLVLALAVPVDRVLSKYREDRPWNCWTCKIRVPFGQLAAELRAAGYNGEGTILADSMHTGGNLGIVFPQARVVVPPFRPETFPSAEGDGPCLIVWPVGDVDPPVSMPENQASYLEDALRATAGDSHRDGVVSVPLFGAETSVYRMAYRLYPAPAGDCR
jgi:hypothetical protein